MPDDDCLNLRLGDHFHQRREPDPAPAPGMPTGPAKAPPPSAPERRG